MNWRQFVPPILWGMGTKASQTANLVVRYLGVGHAVWTPEDYANLAREGYTRNPTVYSCINQIARAAAGIPWLLYRDGQVTGTRRKVYVPSITSKALHRASLKRLVELDIGHPLLKLLGRPNPDQGGAQYVEAVMSYLLISGNSYQEKLEPDSRDAPPRELWTLRPDRMRAVPIGDEKIGKWEYQLLGKKDLDPKHILHMRFFHPTNDVYGLGPVGVARYSVDMDNGADEWNTALIQNGMRPPGILAVQSTDANPYGILPDDQEERLVAKLKEKYAGPENAGQPMLLQGNLKWQGTGLSPVDAAWLQTKNVSGLQICRIFNFPPELAGFPEQKTYSNVQEARKSIYTENVLPLMDRLRDDWNNWLTPRFGDGLRLDYDIDAIEALQEDRQTLWKSVSDTYKGGLLKRNEGRVALGYDEDPDGDVYYKAQTNEKPGADEEDDMGEKLPKPADEDADDEKGSGPCAVKALGLQTEELRVTYWKSFEKKREPWYKKVGTAVTRQFALEKAAVVRAVSGKSTIPEAIAAAGAVVSAQTGEWQKVTLTAYLAVTEAFGKDTIAGLKAGSGPGQRKDTSTGVPDVFDVWDAGVQKWLTDSSTHQITKLLETTHDALRLIEGQAILDGNTIPEIAQMIGELYEGYRGPRSVVIARTITIAASNAGSHFAAAQSGVDLEKFWIATKDTRTRGNKPKDKFSHVKADGQSKPLDKPFEVSGEKLMFPGDTSMGASAGNVVMCRCTQGYKVIEE